MKSDLQILRVQAVSHCLFEPTSLKAAILRMNFIQADPIRSPARAQDLILRHRVNEYRAGDLEKKYPSLDIEEDMLYAYGFLPRRVCRLLYPRSSSQFPSQLSKFEKTVLDTVHKLGTVHPNELATRLGPKRVLNAWGGFSKESTAALDRLHYRGYLRVAKRENGIRIYERSKIQIESMEPEERLLALTKAFTDILGPVPERTLNAAMSSIQRRTFSQMKTKLTLTENLVSRGELIKQIVGGITYLSKPEKGFLDGMTKEARKQVRFLAPFDPLVWDRQRFEHLWGWRYRFEAYTPKAKRVRGYYAMPMLWIDRIIGWANVSMVNGHIDFELGFVDKRPKGKDFSSELDLEISRMKAFLNHKQ